TVPVVVSPGTMRCAVRMAALSLLLLDGSVPAVNMFPALADDVLNTAKRTPTSRAAISRRIRARMRILAFRNTHPVRSRADTLPSSAATSVMMRSNRVPGPEGAPSGAPGHHAARYMHHFPWSITKSESRRSLLPALITLRDGAMEGSGGGPGGGSRGGWPG